MVVVRGVAVLTLVNVDCSILGNEISGRETLDISLTLRLEAGRTPGAKHSGRRAGARSGTQLVHGRVKKSVVLRVPGI